MLNQHFISFSRRSPFHSFFDFHVYFCSVRFFFDHPAPKGQGAQYRLQLTLFEVDGSLATLSVHKGFRRCIQSKAKEFGIGGTILRFDKRDVVVQAEGTHQQLAQFVAFLRVCQQNGMMSRYDAPPLVVIPFRFWRVLIFCVHDCISFYVVVISLVYIIYTLFVVACVNHFPI